MCHLADDSPRAVAAGRAARQRVRSVRIFSSLCEPVTLWGLLSGLAWLSFSQLPVSDHCVADGLKDISLGGIARQLASHGWQESHQEGEEGCEKFISRLVTRKSNKSPESPIICFLEPEPSKCPCKHVNTWAAVPCPCYLVSQLECSSQAGGKIVPGDAEEKGSPKVAPKASPKASPKAAPKASPKDTPKASPKVLPKDSSGERMLLTLPTTSLWKWVRR